MAGQRGSSALRRARERAGQAKFRSQQAVADRAVPALRRVTRDRGPLADRTLFVVAHPRSGSTVLSHVLHHHPEITGFGEHHVGYADRRDLERLAARNAFHSRSRSLPGRYSLDKIVWNQHDIADEVLADSSTRYVFLVREPAATLESYARMFPDFDTDERRLLSYRRRLDGMVDQARRIGAPERMAFVTYDEITGDTGRVLAELTEWLELESPLTSDYGVTGKTGSQSWGDPSANIQAGTILSLDRRDVDIDIDIADEANRLYRATCDTLRSLTTAPAPRDAPATR